jgi:hypothetical protein
MPKNKKAKRKLRERDEALENEEPGTDGSASNGESSTDGRRRAWNTDDLYFDRNGRLVVRNAALAKAIARAVSEQGGIVMQFAYSEDGDIPEPVPGKIPRPPVPPWPNVCPDLLCDKELSFVVRKVPMRDPPRDGSWEQLGRGF